MYHTHYTYICIISSVVSFSPEIKTIATYKSLMTYRFSEAKTALIYHSYKNNRLKRQLIFHVIIEENSLSKEQ